MKLRHSGLAANPAALVNYQGMWPALLEEWLTYGSDRGLGQWRNGGYGAFRYEIWEASEVAA